MEFQSNLQISQTIVDDIISKMTNIGLYDSHGKNILRLQCTLNDIYKKDKETYNWKALEFGLDVIIQKVFKKFQSIISRETLKDILYDIEEVEYDLILMGEISEFLYNVIKLDKESIFFKDKTHQDWQLLNQFIKEIDLDTYENLQIEQKKFEDLMRTGCAYSMIGLQSKNNLIVKVIKQNLGGAYYLFCVEKSRKLNLRNLVKPTMEYIKGVWGILDSSAVVKQTIKSVLVSIAYNKEIFIPRLFEPITLQLLQKEFENGDTYNFQKFDGLIFSDEDIYSLLSSNIQQNDQQRKIQVRLLSARQNLILKKINLNGAVQQVQKLSKDHFEISPLKEHQHSANAIRNIIIHIHGGGWVSMSSFAHQTYTRKWANYLGCDTLIISIDYRLAPEFPYPYALDDCWQVYLWTVYFAQFYLNIEPHKIIITGDSAGGNMALGICLRALRQGIRLPDSLLLSYPALNLNFKDYTPSVLNALYDMITPITILQQVLKAYMKDDSLKPDQDPYLSPAIASDTFLKALPEKFIMICGSLDVLKDECIKFLHRYITSRNIEPNQKYPQLIIYNNISHGFLNYDIPYLGIKQLSQVNQQYSYLLRDLLK